MKIARFEKRILSFLIDELIPTAVGVFCYFLFKKADILGGSLFSMFLTSCLIVYALFILISALSLYFSNGFTLGTAIFGIRVVQTNNKKLTMRNSLVRSISLGVIAFVIANALYMLFVRTERSVFDRLTNTVVQEHRHAGD